MASVTTERFAWLVWGALVALCRADEPEQRGMPCDVREELGRLVTSEATAMAAVAHATQAPKFARVSSCLAYLRALRDTNDRLAQVRQNGTT